MAVMCGRAGGRKCTAAIDQQEGYLAYKVWKKVDNRMESPKE
jgi:hypothetical protein